MDKSGIIGVDIGGTNFRIGIVSADGTVYGFRKVPVGKVFYTNNPLTDLGDYLDNYMNGLDNKEVFFKAVSIGFPATLDAERKMVLQAPNVMFMEKLPVVEALSERFGIPILIERDVTMALYHDCKKYDIPSRGVVCGIYFGTGIGNAIAINGIPLIGKNGVAGELGHIPVDGNEKPCGCGNVGCMENLAGGKYLSHLCESVYKDVFIGDLFKVHGEEPLLQQFVDRMAMVVATEVNILDPDYILIGGGVPDMTGFPKETLVEHIRFHARKPYPANNLNIIFTGDEEAKCVIGGAIYAKERGLE